MKKYDVFVKVDGQWEPEAAFYDLKLAKEFAYRLQTESLAGDVQVKVLDDKGKEV
jgi:hypothetical protein